MNPAKAGGIAATNAAKIATPPLVPPPPQGNTASFFETFWSKVYSFQTPNKVADSIINTGQAVALARDNAINDAKTGIKLGLTLGPLILILGAGLYLYVMFAPKR